MIKKLILVLIIAVVSAGLFFNLKSADALEEYNIEIKNNKFTPDVIKVPEGKKFKLIVKNLDSTPEEFESNDFNREKIIGGGKSAKILVGPLDKGTYKFFGEFNPETAQGKVIVE